MEVYLGIDAGGSKLHGRLADSAGRTMAERIAPADGWNSLDDAGRAKRLRDLAAGLLTACRRDGAQEDLVLVRAGVGAHGCDTDDECSELQEELEQALGAPAEVVNDAVLLGLAAGDPHAADLVVGTGAIAVTLLDDGRTMYSGGWGWLLGDEGSAWGVVREAIRSLCRVADAGDDPMADDLLPALLKQSGAATLRELVARLQTLPPEAWAAWAPAVFDGACNGSDAAAQAVESGCAALAGLVGALVDRGAPVSSVVAGGGVIAHQPLVEKSVARHVASSLALPFMVWREPPVGGAVRLALGR